MARVRLLTDYISRERFFQMPATGISFRRISGALVWPHGERPGCVVALGESRQKQNIVGMERHDLHRLEEVQSSDCAELMDMLMRMSGDWLVKRWATPLCDRRSYMLDDLNDELRKMRRQRLRYGDPPGWSGKGEGLLPFYHALVQRRTASEKTLFLGQGSLCADELAKLDYADMGKSILEWPGAAALCFAVAEIDLDARKDWGDKKLDGEAPGPADDLGGY